MNQLIIINDYECGDCCRYSYLKVDRKLLKLIHEVDILLENASSLTIYEHVAIQSQTDFVPSLAPIVFDQLWQSLMDPRIGIIGLYGTGGVGKTTIMKNIIDQLAHTNTETFDNIIWVTLSMKVNWESVQDDIAMQLNIDLPVLLNSSLEGKDMEMNVRRHRCPKRDRDLIMYKYLRTMKRCLFILDDMWEPIPHDFRDTTISECTIPQSFRHTIIPEPTEDNGCKVVITSRDRSVCAEMGAHKQIYLAPLSQNEAWDLFALHCGEQVLDPNIKSIAQEVVDECGGLPLNIITIGHAMRGESYVAAWRLALRDVQQFQKKGTNEDKFYHLRFCYSRLKNDQIRKCFLYCGVFPENYKFKSKELIGYWMAEDYIKGDIVTSIHRGREILGELRDAKMLELFVEDGQECFKMHGLFRDLAISIATNEYDFKVQAGEKLTNALSTIMSDGGEKLVSMIRNEIEKCSGCRTVGITLSTLLLRDNPLAYISHWFFFLVSNLEFLDMSYTGIAQLPSSICELTRLRVLFLGYCTSLKKMPSLEKLKELQVLNLCGTLIKELPEGMKCLVKLRSLDLSETVRLEDIQDGVISSLSNLEELQMQGSRICKIDSPIVAARLREIRCLKKLSILTLSAVGFGDHLDTILYLRGYNLEEYSINSYGTSEDYVEDF
ncbi:hypothetical protein ACHQM5_021190 [Ranunculus cassubicifolius]